MYPELEGKVAVITGAGRRKGLGEAMAHRLAREGCRVVLTDVGQPGQHMPEGAVGLLAEMQAIVDEINDEGGTASPFACNVLEPGEVEAAAAHARDTYGSLDIWVNNAGIGYRMKPIVDMDSDEWDAVLGVNLRGAFLGIQAAARVMIAQGRGGRIVNIGSQASKSAFANASAYTASKHGLVGLTRVAAMELGGHGITVNAICPNHVTTGLGAWQNEHFSGLSGSSLEQYMADMRARIPLGRPGQQQDIANACAFLCSEQAAYMTGESMNVSGGEEYH